MRAKLDLEQLKRDMLNDCRGAYFGGVFGGAMYASFEIERAEGQELVDLAERMGYDLTPYIEEITSYF